MPATTTTPAIERQLEIAAPPETVFAFLTNGEKLARWMGREAWIEARPGGMIRVDYNGFDVMRGEIIEVTPPTHLVMTWGWESLGDTTPPGGSRVEFHLERAGAGTLLRMVHSGLSAEEYASHASGWDLFLQRLATSAAGGSPDAFAAPLSPAEEYASRLNGLLVQLLEALRRCPASAWERATAGDGRTVAAVANHAIDHLGLVSFARAVGDGVRAPQADFTQEGLDAFNAERASQVAGTSIEATIERLRAGGPGAVAALRAFTPADFAKTQSMAFAGGAHLSAGMLVEGPLLADIAAHLAAVRTAIAP